MTVKKLLLALVSTVFSFVLSAQSNSENDSLTLYTYIGGKADMSYVKAKEQVAKKHGLKTEFFYGDCGGTFDYKASEFEIKNRPAFGHLENIYGVNWKEQFEEEIITLRDKIYKD